MPTNVTQQYESTVFINRTSFIGNLKRAVLPTIANTTSDYETLGMPGTIRLVNGKEAMEATLGWDGNSRPLALAAYDLQSVQEIMIRSQIEVQSSTGVTLVPVVYTINGVFRSKEGGTFEPKTGIAHESTIDCYYFKEEQDGQVMVEYDPVNNIYNVGGKNLFAARNRNLGL